MSETLLPVKQALAVVFTRTTPAGGVEYLAARYALDHPTYANHLGFVAIAKVAEETDEAALSRLASEQLGTTAVSMVGVIGAACKRKEHHILELTLIEASFTSNYNPVNDPSFVRSPKYAAFSWEDDPTKLNDVIADGSVCGLIYQSYRKTQSSAD